MPTFGCELYCKFGAIYRAHPPLYAMWTVVSVIYNVITVTYIQASIFMWTNLCCCWRFPDISMPLILKIWCQIQRSSSSLRYVNCGPEIYNAITVPPIQSSIYKWKYLLWYWIYIDNSMCVIWNTWCQTQRTSSSLRNLNSGPGHIQCNNSSAYSGFNIHLNVSALILVMYRQFNALYTANWLPNTAHILQFTLS
jgi:hypothetical protein